MMNNLKVVFTTEQEPIELDMMSEDAKLTWGMDLFRIENWLDVKHITYPMESPKDWKKNVLPAFIGSVNTTNDVRKTNVKVVVSQVDTYVKSSIGGAEITKEIFFGTEYLRDLGLITLEQTKDDLPSEVYAKMEDLWDAKILYETSIVKLRPHFGKGAGGGTHVKKIPSRRISRAK